MSRHPTRRLRHASAGASALITAAALVASSSPGALASPASDLAGARFDLLTHTAAQDPGDGASVDPAVSADGRYVAFASSADDLVAGDTNRWADAFVLDRETGVTELVSRASDGTLGNGGSRDVQLSADGRFVIFTSRSSNLVAGDDNDRSDAFVHDRETGSTTLVSTALDGSPGDKSSHGATSISDDGRFAAFTSDATDLVAEATSDYGDVFVRDLVAGTTSLVSRALGGGPLDGRSHDAAISGDGETVVFASWATNLTADAPGGNEQIFHLDRETGVMTLVSVGQSGGSSDRGSTAPAVTDDGRVVAFVSSSRNLTDEKAKGKDAAKHVFVRDLDAATTAMIDLTPDGRPTRSSSAVGSDTVEISGDGRYVVFDSPGRDLLPRSLRGQINAYLFDALDQRLRFASVPVPRRRDEHVGSPGVTEGGYVVFDSRTPFVGGDQNTTWDIYGRQVAR